MPALSLRCTQASSDCESGKKGDGLGGGDGNTFESPASRLQKICSVVLWEIRKKVRVQLSFFAIPLLWLRLGSGPLVLLKMLKTSFASNWQFGVLTHLWSA